MTAKEQDMARQLAFDKKEGARLKKLRLSKGISLKFVALSLKRSSGYVWDLENGNRHWRNETIAAYLSAIGEPSPRT